MEALLLSAIRALRSLLIPGMIGVFIVSIALTLAALAAFAVSSVVFFYWLSQALPGSSLSPLLPYLGSAGAVVLAWMLFPGIMPIVISFFDDRIASLIERHDYPQARAISAPFWPQFRQDARFSLLAISLNILVLPLYLLPGVNLVLFYLLNGYLLGREFFTMAARRHLPPADAKALYRRHGTIIIAAGVALTVLATLPVANLFAPFWGVAMMIHLYHRLGKTPSSLHISVD